MARRRWRWWAAEFSLQARASPAVEPFRLIDRDRGGLMAQYVVPEADASIAFPFSVHCQSRYALAED